MKRTIAFILTLVMMIIMSMSSLSVSAADFGFTTDITADYVYMEELNSGTVVHSVRAQEQVPPASLTKIMTYIVVAENIPDLENTYITVTSDMLATMDPESSVMGLSHHIDADGTEVSALELLSPLVPPHAARENIRIAARKIAITFFI